MSTRSGSKAALLVVDVQVGVVANAWDRNRVVENIALAVRRARDADVAIVWVQHQDDELKPDTPAWCWVPELQPASGDIRIHKGFNSAFEGTGLLSELDRLGVSRIFLAGAATNWCIRATAYGALERGFDLTLLSDAHTTENMEPAPGRVVEARSMVDDLNAAMHWLSYPGRANAAVPAGEAAFA
ncbi:MAG TPA: isochorismatase family protein [Burkholderiaceae bacterium]|nr:isochorismatase family protein [Burkholderiaceae bacterium]